MNPHIAGDRKTLCELYEIELLNEARIINVSMWITVQLMDNLGTALKH